MKRIFFFLFLYLLVTNIAYSQYENNRLNLNNIEVFYSPFQTRIGGLEYDEIIVNRNLSRPNTEYSDANYFKTVDFEIGANYRFLVAKKEFGVGVSFYRDSYVFELKDVFRNLRYKFENRGLSMNLFYTTEIFKSTKIEIGLNSRFRLNFKNNLADYDKELSIIGPEYNSKLTVPSFVSFVPRLSFQTKVYNGFYLNYGMLLKFWGNNIFSANTVNRNNPNEKYLDFSLNSSVSKTYIGISYKF